MIRTEVNLEPDLVFIGLEKHGISVGIPIGELPNFDIKFSGFDKSSVGEKVLLREVVNLDSDYDKEVTLRVSYGKSIEEKDLEILKYKDGDWKPLGGTRVPEKHGKWAGYLEVKTIIGDPPIAVG